MEDKDYPLALPTGYYGMNRDELKDVFESLWEDQLTILVAHIIKNNKKFKSFDEQCNKGVMFTTIKKIISKLWIDGNITMDEANNFYNMFISPDDENFVVSVEVLKAKFPKSLNRKI